MNDPYDEDFEGKMFAQKAPAYMFDLFLNTSM